MNPRLPQEFAQNILNQPADIVVTAVPRQWTAKSDGPHAEYFAATRNFEIDHIRSDQIVDGLQGQCSEMS